MRALAILLAIASFVSIYWVTIGLESALHGFDWLLLILFCIIASTAGLVGGAVSRMKKGPALTLIAACLPLLENAVVVEYPLDNYQLATPWTGCSLGNRNFHVERNLHQDVR